MALTVRAAFGGGGSAALSTVTCARAQAATPRGFAVCGGVFGVAQNVSHGGMEVGDL